MKNLCQIKKIAETHQTKVSFFRTYADQQPANIGLVRWLAGSDCYAGLLSEIRHEPDKEKRKLLKMQLPCITPSGLFAGRGEANLIQHSGFLSLDIDKVNTDHVKNKLSELPYIFYAGISASGNGVWALVRIDRPQQHQAFYQALKTELAGKGITLDPAGGNVSQLRFYSFDPDPVFNFEAESFSRVVEVKKLPVLSHAGEDEKVNLLLSEIEHTRTDITQTYFDWLKVGGVLANVFGEAGRAYFHAFSCLHPAYEIRATDRQFDNCLRHKKTFGLNMLFAIAARYGVYIKKF